MEPFRILVTGTRRNSPATRRFVRDKLGAASIEEDWPQDRDWVIVHGQCPYGGVDFYAEEWGRDGGHTAERYPASRDSNGRLLGPARNTIMVNTDPDFCVGFPAAGSRGTWDCLAKAVNRGIPTRVFVVPAEPQGPA